MRVLDEISSGLARTEVDNKNMKNYPACKELSIQEYIKCNFSSFKMVLNMLKFNICFSLIKSL